LRLHRTRSLDKTPESAKKLYIRVNQSSDRLWYNTEHRNLKFVRHERLVHPSKGYGPLKKKLGNEYLKLRLIIIVAIEKPAN